jgi:hypothetical protein
MLLDTRNKTIYGLLVGISMVYNIFEHFWFKDTEPLHMVMNKNIYSSGLGISLILRYRICLI